MGRLYSGSGDRQRIHNSFGLLWCEECGKADETPRRPSMPDIAADPVLRCGECGAPLALLECILRGIPDPSWRPGMVHRTVASYGSLPDGDGRFR